MNGKQHQVPKTSRKLEKKFIKFDTPWCNPSISADLATLNPINLHRHLSPALSNNGSPQALNRCCVGKHVCNSWTLSNHRPQHVVDEGPLAPASCRADLTRELISNALQQGKSRPETRTRSAINPPGACALSINIYIIARCSIHRSFSSSTWNFAHYRLYMEGSWGWPNRKSLCLPFSAITFYSYTKFTWTRHKVGYSTCFIF